jgi:outer membrane protein OmpA-like peptidoglycan-associated protein
LESTIVENINRNSKPVGEPIASISANPPVPPTVDEVKIAPQQFDWPALDLTGIQQVYNQGKLRVIFDDGLFSHGTYFKPGAKARLTAVIKALAQSKQRLVIEVVGYSDGDQGFFGPLDPYSTGLKRAATTVDFIRSLALFSPGQLQASSEGSAQLPFPNDSAKGGAKNRTVILKISRDE